MEVHAHTHTSRNKWTHYFYEFLMLFLAVFCGFMAENFREHSIEHKRAKQFALSLLNDIKADTAALETAIGFGNNKMKDVDSLVVQLELPRERWNDLLIYKLEGTAGRIRPFAHNSGTYEQMKSSGSLRYFRQDLTDLLNQYDVQAKKTVVRENIHLNYAANLLNPFMIQIMDARSLIEIQDGIIPTRPLVFRKSDKETIAMWINYAIVVRSTQERTVSEYQTMLAKANQVLIALQNEYHLSKN